MKDVSAPRYGNGHEAKDTEDHFFNGTGCLLDASAEPVAIVATTSLNPNTAANIGIGMVPSATSNQVKTKRIPNSTQRKYKNRGLIPFVSHCPAPARCVASTPIGIV